MILLIKSQILH